MALRLQAARPLQFSLQPIHALGATYDVPMIGGTMPSGAHLLSYVELSNSDRFSDRQIAQGLPHYSRSRLPGHRARRCREPRRCDHDSGEPAVPDRSDSLERPS